MNIFHNFYVQPMNLVYIETIAIYVVWTIAMLVIRGKVQRIISIIGTAIAVGLVFLFTIRGRSGIENYELSLIPFISFDNAKTQPELYRTMYMNVLLFMPLGLSLPFALSGKIKHNVLISILIGFLLSAVVETVQYLFHLGRCETDDVIMNTLGVIIGTTSFVICIFRDRIRNTFNE